MQQCPVLESTTQSVKFTPAGGVSTIIGVIYSASYSEIFAK